MALVGWVVGRKRRYSGEMQLLIELDREDDGRWIADVCKLPGVMCYGATRDEAVRNVELLAIEVIADRIAHGELPSSALSVSFTVPDEYMALQ
jgi:predicted RNase H-like HicB family nuclease